MGSLLPFGVRRCMDFAWILHCYAVKHCGWRIMQIAGNDQETLQGVGPRIWRACVADLLEKVLSNEKTQKNIKHFYWFWLNLEMLTSKFHANASKYHIGCVGCAANGSLYEVKTLCNIVQCLFCCSCWSTCSRMYSWPRDMVSSAKNDNWIGFFVFTYHAMHTFHQNYLKKTQWHLEYVVSPSRAPVKESNRT